MKSRIFRQFLDILLLFFLNNSIYTVIYAQDNMNESSITVTKLDTCLFKIFIPETTILASVGPDGTLIVDALVEGTGEIIKSELEKIGSKKIDYIVNTHWHFDHADGNKYLGKGATIIAHEKVRQYLSSDQTIRDKFYEAYPDYAIPQITFNDTITFYFNGETIKLIPLIGGHTDSDIIVYFEKAKLVQIGDLCFADMIPFIDVEHGGNVIQMANHLQTIIETVPEDVRVFCGHGREYNIADLKNYREMLLSCIEIIDREIKKGTSLEEMINNDVLSKWNSWERAFTTEELTGFIYQSLKMNSNKN